MKKSHYHLEQVNIARAGQRTGPDHDRVRELRLRTKACGVVPYLKH